MNIESIKNDIDIILPEIINFRHRLHSEPELSLKEYNTSKLIREQLKKLELEILPPYLKTDVIAFINKGNERKNITLRADTDALAIKEDNKKISYSSKNVGVMHACGHDGHTAILLGASIILSKIKAKLNGSVRFVFQPGEENVAAGRDLVELGILESPMPDAVLALHGWPGIPEGVITSKPNNFMAALDTFKVTIKGEGGHGAAPEKTKDPILTASSIVQNLYSLPTKKFGVLERVVFSIGKIHGGENPNVIPNEVILEGTARYFGKEIAKEMPTIFEDFISSECIASGCSYELNYLRPYIPTINNADIVAKCKTYTKENLGENFWIDMDEPVMASEDFAFYIEKNPGAMFFLGMGENSPQLHTSSYSFNDNALRNGILFFVISTIKLLNDSVID